MVLIRKLNSVNLVAKTNITKNMAILLHEQSEGIERHIIVTGIDRNTQILEFSKDLDIYSKGTFLVGSAGAESDWDDSTNETLSVTAGNSGVWKLVDFGDIKERIVYVNIPVPGDEATVYVQVSNDNVNYVEIASINAYASSALIKVVKSTFRYLRVYWKDESIGTSGTIYLTSIEVFNLDDALNNVTLLDNKFVDVTVKTDKDKYNVFILTTNCNYSINDIDYTSVSYIYVEEV